MFGSSSSKRKTMTHPYIQLSCALRTVMHSTPRSIIWARGVSTCPFYVTIRHSSFVIGASFNRVASSSFLRQQRAIKVVGLFGKGPRTERGRWPRREREREKARPTPFPDGARLCPWCMGLRFGTCSRRLSTYRMCECVSSYTQPLPHYFW